jgi:acylphosphatase
MSADGSVARRLVVHGRVQGVFFRASTRDQARASGVAGWVRNRADGAVEVWLEGREDAVGQVERWIRAGGPDFAAVDRVEAELVPPEGHAGFVVRHDAH